MTIRLEYSEFDKRREIRISKRDWDRLEPGEYLNDTLIQFWLKFYHFYVMPESQQGDVYIFDTQFFSLMTSKGYEAVKNWTRKKSILDKKWLVFPIC